MRALFRSRYRIILLSLTLTGFAVIWFISRLPGGFVAGLGQLFLSGVICLLGLFFWLFFFSQFVLPVRKLEDRWQIYQRLLLYIKGGHGPAIFIENGKIRQRKGEIKKEGPGVIILDSASAAVLRKEDRFNRAIGPGITFTERKEYLEGDKAVVDLRIQKGKIGPFLSAGAPTGIGDDQPARLEVQQRQRMETRALTRDNIELVPKIIVHFKIDAQPGEGGSQYGYRASSVEKAILRRNVDANLPEDTPDRLNDWRWLPPRLAADVWKETLSRFRLDELFHSRTDQPTALQSIHTIIHQRLTQPLVDELDLFGKPTGQQVPSLEYQMLQERGIRVLKVEIRDLEMPEEVEKDLIKRWQTSWLNQARKEKEMIETQRQYITRESQEQAIHDFFTQAVSPLAEVCSDQGITVRRAFHHLIHSILNLLERNPQSQTKLQQEIEQLTQLVEMSTPEESE
ncbi:MAG: hypothetical protein KatS3mg045_1149 [Bellilinea sp.]|nr:MAG: hypothetical protein KatS3mg045_1149 [Bellilinea sp.]